MLLSVSSLLVVEKQRTEPLNSGNQWLDGVRAYSKNLEEAMRNPFRRAFYGNFVVK
jgi:hypothetical protein